jgi:hypothetical protein
VSVLRAIPAGTRPPLPDSATGHPFPGPNRTRQAEAGLTAPLGLLGGLYSALLQPLPAMLMSGVQASFWRVFHEWIHHVYLLTS